MVPDPPPTESRNTIHSQFFIKFTKVNYNFLRKCGTGEEQQGGFITMKTTLPTFYQLPEPEQVYDNHSKFTSSS